MGATFPILVLLLCLSLSFFVSSSPNTVLNTEEGKEAMGQYGKFGEEVAPRRKRFVIESTFVIAQLISVFTGVLTNDMVIASWYDKMVYCLGLLYQNAFLRGWKRCSNYAQRSYQKWKHLLKQHHLEALIRIVAQRLRAASPVHFKEALYNIEKEFEKLLLQGDEALRVLDLLKNTGIGLPSIYGFHADHLWEKKPELKDQLGRWRQLDVPEKDLLIANCEILELLKRDYTHLFSPDKPLKQMDLVSSIVQIDREKGRLKLHLKSTVGGHTSEFTQSLLKRFIAKILARQDTLTSKANAFFMRAQFAFFAGALAEIVAKTPQISKNGELLKMYNQHRHKWNELSRCLLEAAYSGKYGQFEGRRHPAGEVLKWALRSAEKVQKAIVLSEDELKDFEQRLHETLLSSSDIQDSNMFCENILKMDELNPEMGTLVTKANGKTGIELDAESWGAESEQGKQSAFVRQMLSETERFFFDWTEREQAEAKQLEPTQEATKLDSDLDAMRAIAEDIEQHRDNNSDVLVGTDDRDVLLVHARLVLFGYTIAKDFVAHEKALDQLANFVGTERLRVHSEGLPQKFDMFAFRLLELANRAGAGSNVENKSLGALVAEVEHVLAEMSRPPAINDDIQSDANIAKMMDQLEGISTRETRISEKMVAKLLESAKSVLNRKKQPKPPQQSHDGVEQWKVHRAWSNKRAKSAPIKADDTKPQRRRRKKRFVDALIEGMATGFTGNVISEYVDVSLTLRNWMGCSARPWKIMEKGGCFRLVWRSETKKKVREKAIAAFVEKIYLALFIKLAEVETDLSKMMHEVEAYLHRAIREEGLDSEGLNLEHLLDDLDLFTYRNVRHTVNEHLDKSEQAHSKMNIVSTMHKMEFFSEQRWEKERERILREMSEEERQKYWKEVEAAKKQGTSPDLPAYVRQLRKHQIEEIRQKVSREKGQKLVAIEQLEREIGKQEQICKSIEQNIGEIKMEEAKAEHGRIEVKSTKDLDSEQIVESGIRQNEAVIRLLVQQNERMRRLAEQHRQLGRARRELEQMKTNLGVARRQSGTEHPGTRALSENEQNSLREIARFQLLVSATGAMQDDLAKRELRRQHLPTVEHLKSLLVHNELVLSLIRALGLDLAGIKGKRRGEPRHQWAGTMVHIVPGNSQTKAINLEQTFREMLLDRLNKALSTGMNMERKAEERLPAKYSDEWMQCETDYLMEGMVREANGETLGTEALQECEAREVKEWAEKAAAAIASQKEGAPRFDEKAEWLAEAGIAHA